MDFEIIRKVSDKHQKAILFVHGANHAAWCWEEHFLDYFYSNDYDVYALSFRNHESGVKDKGTKENISLDDYAEDVCNVAFTIHKPLIGIAHSLGCNVIQRAVVKEPEKFIKIVLMNPMPVYKIFRTLAKMNLRILHKEPKQIFFAERLDDSLENMYLNKLVPEPVKVKMGLLGKSIPLGFKWMIPTLILGSFADVCTSSKTIIETANYLNGEVHIFKDLCHDMMLDPQWESAAKCILQFLGQEKYIN